MWILLLIVLNAGLPPTVGVLQSYSTLQACESERVRIQAAMDQSYPEEIGTFYLECKPAKKGQR